MNRLQGVLAAAAVSLLPSPSAATEIRLGSEITWVHDSSYDAFWTDDGMTRFDLGLSYTVARPSILLLDVEAGYRYAGHLGADIGFAAMSTSLSLHEAYAGVRAAFDVGLSWFRPYARLQSGALFGTASFLDEAAGAVALEDWAPAAVVSAGAGVEFVLPPSFLSAGERVLLTEAFTFGVFVESGYSYRSALSFSPRRPESDDPEVEADLIPAAGFSAGDLSLSGADLRIGLLARF
ncbi:MAG: hypothetical protein QME96_06435 [Myxococcota bacterium]|nr:hypothetical protein [Myxococcota bacterium]